MSGSNGSNGSTNPPSRVRATAVVVDDGNLFALPGQVGKVIDSEVQDDGVVALTVQFPDAPYLTTCYLGLDVVAVLSVVPLAESPPMAEQLEPPRQHEEPTPEQRPSLAARAFTIWPRRVSPMRHPRRAAVAALVACAACVLAVLVWRAPGAPEAMPTANVPVQLQTPTVEDGGLADIAPPVGPVFLALDRSVPEKPEDVQKRPPCDPELGEVPINGACYVVLAMRPPCGKLWRSGDRCVRPVLKGQRTPNSIDGGHE